MGLVRLELVLRLLHLVVEQGGQAGEGPRTRGRRTLWSVRSFSSVHFSILDASLSLSCWMYCTARWRIEPLFFSHPGTIFLRSLMPSLIVSRRRRSTSFCEVGEAWPGSVQLFKLEGVRRLRIPRSIMVPKRDKAATRFPKVGACMRINSHGSDSRDCPCASWSNPPPCPCRPWTLCCPRDPCARGRPARRPRSPSARATRARSAGVR